MDGGPTTAVQVPESLLHRVQSGLRSVTLRPSSWTIFTVPNKLRNLNADAYTPHVLSIGPFHHGSSNLEGMQTHKWRYTLSLLDRTEDAAPTMESCLKAILGFESQIRSCYAEEIRFSSSDLAEILFLDGCFILELFLRYSNIEPNLKHGDLQNDPIFTTSWIISTLQRDMVLLENQIPFFLLEWLFDYTVRRSSSGLLSVPLVDIAVRFFESTVNGLLIRTPSSSDSSIRIVSRLSTKHLLHLIHTIHLPYAPNPERTTTTTKTTRVAAEYTTFMPSASDLQAAEIKIQRHEGKSMFDLVFSEGVLKIPPLRILDSTDALLRNLVAFEQCFHGCEQYVTSYALLMDQLIYTTSDVELLEQSGVVENYMGSREDVTYLFENICKQIGLHEFHFSVLCNAVNRSYNRPWIQYKMALKRDYFTSPWTLVSVLAVLFIVAMTMLQTLYTVFSYHSSHK